MQLAMVGLGRMGANMVRRLEKGGHDCVVYDVSPEAVKALESEGATGSTSLDDLVAKLEAPRAVWIMVPAAITGKMVDDLAGRLEAGDTIIDGGNSYYRDDIDRAESLRSKGLHYVDVGTSGGVWGLERGYCLMVGGDAEAVERLEPVFLTLAPGVGSIDRTPGPHRRPEPGRAGLPPLRAERRRPLREDGPQRHRVRRHDRLCRGPQHPARRRCRHSARRRPMPRRHRSGTRSTTSTTSISPRWPRCGAAAASSPPGCST